MIPRTSFNDALSIFKADDAKSIQSFSSQLKSLASLYSNIYIDIPNPSSKRSPRTAKSLLRYLSPPVQPKSEYETVVESLSASRRHDLAPHVAKLRAIKSEREQQVMRAAADISGRSLAKVNLLTMPKIVTGRRRTFFYRPCDLPVLGYPKVQSQLILNICVVSPDHND